MNIQEAKKILDTFFSQHPEMLNMPENKVVDFIATLPTDERKPIETAIKVFALFGGCGAKTQ